MKERRGGRREGATVFDVEDLGGGVGLLGAFRSTTFCVRAPLLWMTRLLLVHDEVEKGGHEFAGGERRRRRRRSRCSGAWGCTRGPLVGHFPPFTPKPSQPAVKLNADSYVTNNTGQVQAEPSLANWVISFVVLVSTSTGPPVHCRRSLFSSWLLLLQRHERERRRQWG